MLIIRGASYTPPSGSSGGGTPVLPDDPTPVIPDPPHTSDPYEVFYQVGDAWTLSRPGGVKVTGVGLVVSDRFAADVDAISFDYSESLGTVYLCLDSSPIEVENGSFNKGAGDFGDMFVIQDGRTDFQPGTRAFVVWFYNSNGLTSGNIEDILTAAKTAVTFITG